MRTNGSIVDADVLARLERKHLEVAWRRAWTSCSRAAQAGDYAEAERWHKQATLLGSELTVSDRALGETRQWLAYVL
jgi:hypothetical protein